MRDGAHVEGADHVFTGPVHRVVDLQPLEEGRERARVLIHRKAHDDDLALVLGCQADKIRDLLTAGGAPGGEEVEHDDLALVLGHYGGQVLEPHGLVLLGLRQAGQEQGQKQQGQNKSLHGIIL